MKQKLGIVLILFSIILMFFYFAHKKNLERKNISDVSNYINDTSTNKEIVKPTKLPEKKRNKRF